MPTFKFTGPDGKQYTVNGPDGATEQQAMQMLQAKLNAPATPAPPIAPVAKQEKSFSQEVADTVADVPRQVGLTARYGIEGAGGLLDFLATPIRLAGNAVLPKEYQAQPGGFAKIADAIGLPKPANSAERIVGDATRLLAGGAAPIAGAARFAQGAAGVPKAVAQLMSARPAQQLVASGAAGAAGGSTREAGGGPELQFLASLATGLATPVAMNATQGAGSSLRRLAGVGTAPKTQQQMDAQINSAMTGSGMTLAELPIDVQAGIRQDVAKAYQLSDTLAPAALRRLADYRMTGMTPTAGGLTLDPAIVTQQKNLAKLGINSKDPQAQQLGQTENANNRRLIELMNDAGAGTAGDAVTGGQKVINALGDRNARATKLINQRYSDARSTDGRDALIDPAAFTNRANDLLDDALLGMKLPPDVSKLMNNVSSGKIPLTVDTAEQIKTRLTDLAKVTNDHARVKSLSLVRQALDEAPLIDGQGKEAIEAFNSARALHKSWMEIVEKTPALKAVRDGIEPDKFMQQFVIGNGPKANISDVEALWRSVKANPQATTAIREQIVAHLKKEALNGATDELGKFSQSAYNKALDAIGPQKLSVFFNKSQVDQLKAIGRVAGYEQFQPSGAAVNNSNTASTGWSALLDRVAQSPLLSKVPFGKMLAEPAQNISTGLKSTKALDVPSTLAVPGAPSPSIELPVNVLQPDSTQKIRNSND